MFLGKIKWANMWKHSVEFWVQHRSSINDSFSPYYWSFILWDECFYIFSINNSSFCLPRPKTFVAVNGLIRGRWGKKKEEVIILTVGPGWVSSGVLLICFSSLEEWLAYTPVNSAHFILYFHKEVFSFLISLLYYSDYRVYLYSCDYLLTSCLPHWAACSMQAGNAFVCSVPTVCKMTMTAPSI